MKKAWKIIIIIAVIIVISMAILKSVTNEDDWICKDGKWVKHGFPSSEKPIEPCEENFMQRMFDSKSS
jgi:uncharacterized protein YxeA